MKKLNIVWIAVCMLFLLSACGSQNQSLNSAVNPEGTTAPQETTAPEKTVTPEPTAPEETLTPVPTTEAEVTPEAGTETEFVLGQYKGLEVKNVTKEMVDAEIKAYLAELVIYEPVDRAAQEGDTVNINYVGKLDGVAFDGGTDASEEGHNLLLGSDSFIDGFEDGLVGAVAGEVRDLTLTFPENYHSTDMAGKTVVFTVTVNAVQQQVEAELTDEFVVNNFVGFESAQDYWDDVYALMNEQYQQSQVANQLLENSQLISYPEEQVQAEAQGMVDYYVSYADYYSSMLGQTTDVMLQYFFGFDSVEALEEYAQEYSYRLFKNRLVMTAIAMQESITVTEEEYNNRLPVYAEEYGYTDLAAFETDYTKETIREL